MSFAQYNRLGVHVADSNITVIRQASTMLHPHDRVAREKREPRHIFYREMLAYHEAARRVFAAVTQ